MLFPEQTGNSGSGGSLGNVDLFNFTKSVEQFPNLRDSGFHFCSFVSAHSNRCCASHCKTLVLEQLLDFVHEVIRLGPNIATTPIGRNIATRFLPRGVTRILVLNRSTSGHPRSQWTLSGR